MGDKLTGKERELYQRALNFIYREQCELDKELDIQQQLFFWSKVIGAISYRIQALSEDIEKEYSPK